MLEIFERRTRKGYLLNIALRPNHISLFVHDAKGTPMETFNHFTANILYQYGVT
jgi:hypothetical protein